MCVVQGGGERERTDAPPVVSSLLGLIRAEKRGDTQHQTITMLCILLLNQSAFPGRHGCYARGRIGERERVQCYAAVDKRFARLSTDGPGGFDGWQRVRLCWSAVRPPAAEERRESLHRPPDAPKRTKNEEECPEQGDQLINKARQWTSLLADGISTAAAQTLRSCQQIVPKGLVPCPPSKEQPRPRATDPNRCGRMVPSSEGRSHNPRPSTKEGRLQQHSARRRTGPFREPYND